MQFRLVSAQEGDPEHPRAIILFHGTSLVGNQSEDYRTWGSDPAGNFIDPTMKTTFMKWWQGQWLMRQMYSLYAINYDTVSIAAPQSASVLYEMVSTHNGRWAGAVSANKDAYHRCSTWGTLSLDDQFLDHRRYQVDNDTLTIPLAGPQTRAEEVILVGYSQGGLVAREFALRALDDGQRRLNIKKIVYLATPHDGVPVTFIVSLIKELVTVGVARATDNYLLGDAVAEGSEEALRFKYGGLLFMKDLKSDATVQRYHKGVKSWRDLHVRLKAAGIAEYAVRGVQTMAMAVPIDEVKDDSGHWISRTLHGARLTAKFTASRAWDGVLPGDGCASETSALGAKNGPGAIRYTLRWLNARNYYGYGENSPQYYNLNRFFHLLTSDNGPVGPIPMLHAVIPNEWPVLDNVRQFILDNNPRAQEIVDRRQTIERLYHDYLGRSYVQGGSIEVEVGGEVKRTPVPGDYIYARAHPEFYADWARNFARSPQTVFLSALVNDPTHDPRQERVRYSDDEGLYSWMWVEKDASGYPLQNVALQQRFLASEERRKRLEALTAELGVVPSDDLSTLTMAAVLKRYRP